MTCWRRRRRMRIGILAYGSLISNPGPEIGPRVRRVEPMRTPFKVEFARSSTGRNGAPTLVPVKTGGDRANAVVLVLDDSVTPKDAHDMLYRREADKIGTKESYVARGNPGPDTIVIKELAAAHGAERILYTEIRATIEDLTPEHLADLAVKSARAEAGTCGRDGITYLRDAKEAGIETPLTAAYESEILKETGTATLNEAIQKLTSKGTK